MKLLQKVVLLQQWFVLPSCCHLIDYVQCFCTYFKLRVLIQIGIKHIHNPSWVQV